MWFVRIESKHILLILFVSIRIYQTDSEETTKRFPLDNQYKYSSWCGILMVLSAAKSITKQKTPEHLKIEKKIHF